MFYDTIAAICTGLSSSGLNVIRISGEDAFSVADKIFMSVSGKKVSDMKSFSVNYGYIVDNDITIDEVLLLKMKAPKSYTRENVIEIDCHGGIVVTKNILDLVLANGARLAEPGEFTKRAFLNGRIDLSQAEAVIDVINSKTDMALRSSISQLKGSVKSTVTDIREALLSKTAYIEAALDDPEHISLDGFSDTLKDELISVSSKIQKLIDSYHNGKYLKDGIKTVILGRPNAGKSSLLNDIIGHERAIVTDIAGTTRDTIEEYVTVNGILLDIIDTAGLRNTDDIIEKIGVDKALSCAGEADLILYVIDSVSGLSSEDEDTILSLKDKKVIILFNKSDLEDSVSFDSLSSQLQGFKVVKISALNKSGLDDLYSIISDMFFSGKLDSSSDVIITNLRHKNLLTSALNDVNNVLKSIECGMSEDFYTIDLMSAYTYLGLITGDNVEDDLADKIFSDFCMGK